MSARAWTILAAVSTLWGIPYLFIKIADKGGVTPGVLAWGRITLGAFVLLALARRSGSLRGLRGRWRWVALYAIVEVSIPFPLAAGEEHISSSLAAIIIATVPLLVALLALRFDPAETATGKRLVGLFVGLVGVIVLVGIDASGNLETLLGAGAVLVAAVGYASGPMVFKRHLADLDPRHHGCQPGHRRRHPHARGRPRPPGPNPLGGRRQLRRRARARVHGARLLAHGPPHRRDRPGARGRAQVVTPSGN
jgi:drug/metabolite transporter (DMT)-like permease